MTVASIMGSLCGIAIGGRSGVGGAVLGAIVGVVASAALVLVVNAVITIGVRTQGRDPREVGAQISAAATWGVAAIAAAATVGALVGLY